MCSRAWPAGASSQMVDEDLVMSKILTRAAFENAIRANAAIGGSTNAVIHLLALAGRAGVELSLDDWDRARPRPAVPGRPACPRAST
jgi:dihydroxyacid dehydratase/phosphogluconate dehydratase